MKPYPEYKPAGLAWLPEIPKHWTTRKIKYIFRERSEKGYPDEPLLAATQNHGVIPKNLYGARTVEAQKDLHLLKLVRVGDFVISLRSFQGGIEYAYYQGIISPAYTIMIPDSCLIDSGYFRYLAKSPNFIALLQTCVTGIREGQNIDYSTLRRHSLPLPPADEQAQIVRYLDAMTAKINKLIRAKKRRIALLQEQKQAIINQAVTRGLDPDVELKDSGIDWLGPIPKHWTQNKVGHFYKSVLGKMLASTPSSNNDSYEKYLCAKDVHFSGIDLSDLKQMWFSPEEKKKYMLQKGDLLIVEGGAGAGGSAVFNGYEGPVYIQNSIHLLRPQNSKNVVKFLYYWLYSLIGRKYIDFACNKATIPHYTGDKLFETPFLFIPLEEQKQIVAFLDNACEKYNKTISNLNDEISHITEFKNSLISSVITGQVDIRKIALEEVDPADLIAEIDDDSTGEESLEESEE